MPLPVSLALVGVAAGTFLAAPAGDVWARVRSPHLEVLSDAGPAPAREAAFRLEQLRVVLLRLFPASGEVRRPITLLVLESQARFTSLAPRESDDRRALAGFFQGGRERDYAVLHLSPESARPFEPAEHDDADEDDEEDDGKDDEKGN